MAFHLGDANLSLTNQGGAFDFFESVFRFEDVDAYRPMIQRTHFFNKDGEKRAFKSKTFYYKTFWRTAQMSNNLPIWTEIITG